MARGNRRNLICIEYLRPSPCFAATKELTAGRNKTLLFERRLGFRALNRPKIRRGDRALKPRVIEFPLPKANNFFKSDGRLLLKVFIANDQYRKISLRSPRQKLVTPRVNILHHEFRIRTAQRSEMGRR